MGAEDAATRHRPALLKQRWNQPAFLRASFRSRVGRLTKILTCNGLDPPVGTVSFEFLYDDLLFATLLPATVPVPGKGPRE